MDRDAMARAARRRHAEEALAAERDRADVLREEIERLAGELEGARIDEEAFARMAPEDAVLVRELIQPPALPEDEIAADESWVLYEDDLVVGEEPDPHAELEAEIARLEAEVAVSGRVQAALERYLEALAVDADRTGSLSAVDLAARFAELEPAPRGNGAVRLICVRVDEGVHETPDRAEVSVEEGLVGDRWARGKADPDAQITLMNARVAELVGGPLDLAGDNFQVDLDLSEEALPVGTRLRLGDALLEVSPAPHTGCKKFKERFGMEALLWVNEHKDLRLRGVNCRVIEGGAVAVGDTIAVV